MKSIQRKSGHNFGRVAGISSLPDILHPSGIHIVVTNDGMSDRFPAESGIDAKPHRGDQIQLAREDLGGIVAVRVPGSDVGQCGSSEATRTCLCAVLLVFFQNRVVSQHLCRASGQNKTS